jgi:hypothetical protein
MIIFYTCRRDEISLYNKLTLLPFGFSNGEAIEVAEIGTYRSDKVNK